MTNYLKNITQDSFSGIIFGFEGIRRTVVLINGPTGCKYYHSAISANQFVQEFEFDPLKYPHEWYFGQPRVPCTYLDKTDYVYGTKEKLLQAFKFFEKNDDCDLLCIVNSPGATLIGDDLGGIAELVLKDTPYIVIESPGFSRTFGEGFEIAMLALISQTEKLKKTFIDGNVTKNEKKDTKDTEAKKKTVNLLGISIINKYYEGDIEEIIRLLGLCGIEVNCALGVNCKIADIVNLGEADVNIVLNRDMGEKTARKLQETYNTPYYICEGSPIGFEATEKMMADICQIIGGEFEKFMEESEKARARAYVYISRINSLTGLPKGVKFAVAGTGFDTLSYVLFFVKYFGMVAESILLTDEAKKGKLSKEGELLKAFLEKRNMQGALEKDIFESAAELVFANGSIIAALKNNGNFFSGIETSLPSIGYVDVVPKTHVGLKGALMLTEQVLNGIMF